MNFRLLVLIGLCLVGTVAASGCAFPPANANRSTSENISVSERSNNGVCAAAITVQESVNGRKHTVQQANVPCSNEKAVQSQLAAQAKQGL